MNRFHRTACLLAALIICGCSHLSRNRQHIHRAADILGGLPPDHGQAVLVLAGENRPERADVSAWERTGGRWVKKFAAMQAVIGRSGFAVPGEKKEGDGRTPSGIFKLKRAFGYAPHMETGLDYRQATEHDFWVDDPASAQYNRWVKGAPQADSYEVLRRGDKLYEYAIVIEYNTETVIPGKGSAIFLHVWRDKGAATAGCVAASAKNVKKLLNWLDLSKKPVILLGDEQD